MLVLFMRMFCLKDEYSVGRPRITAFTTSRSGISSFKASRSERIVATSSRYCVIVLVPLRRVWSLCPKLINMSGGHGVVPCGQSIPEGSRCGEAASMFVNGGADDR
ncbi:unnamed protein product [Cuscuta campestris]|uniref:Uncharacterized protein n=1 Tax=Cuscuta campestris TaxID=132261 RepID=A0A484MZX7_9ASTE|nr:unnamed protein product [Cuscuta campestris]